MSVLEIRQKVVELLAPILERYNAFLVDVHVRADHGIRSVEVFADTDVGITIDECARISRELSGEFDLHPVVEGSFHLEVSSPGLDKPLKLLRQYRKNVGRKFRVTYQTGPQRATLTATLVEVADERLTFQPETGEAISLSFQQIIESKEELPW